MNSNKKNPNPVGRPLSTNPANKRVVVKVTPEQHKAWMALGASKWLKRILDSEVAKKMGL